MELTYIELPSRSAIVFIGFIVMLVPAVFITKWTLKRARARAEKEGIHTVDVYVRRRRTRLLLSSGENATVMERIAYWRTVVVVYLGWVVMGGIVPGVIILLLFPISTLQRVEADGTFCELDDKCVFQKSRTGYLFENRSADTVFLLYPSADNPAVVETQVIAPHSLEEIPNNLSISDMNDPSNLKIVSTKLDNYTATSIEAVLVKKSNSGYYKVQSKL